MFICLVPDIWKYHIYMAKKMHKNVSILISVCFIFVFFLTVFLTAFVNTLWLKLLPTFEVSHLCIIVGYIFIFIYLKCLYINGPMVECVEY